MITVTNCIFKSVINAIYCDSNIKSDNNQCYFNMFVTGLKLLSSHNNVHKQK